MSTRRVLVTGAGTGLGLETALYLASRGYVVYASVLNGDQQEHVVATAAERGVTLFTPLLDVTSGESITNALAGIFDDGALLGVVHNAGIGLRGYFEDCDDDEIRQVMDVNLFGAMDVTRAVLPHMRENRCGRLIFVSSVGARIASMARTAYCSSKFGVEGFAESLMQEVKPFGIQVCIVEPAIINTERWNVNRGIARRALDSASPYRHWFERQEELADRLVRTSPTQPIHVAEQVHRALTDSPPRLRYVAGRRAGFILQLRRYLPGETFERLYFGQAMRRIASDEGVHAEQLDTTSVQSVDKGNPMSEMRAIINVVRVLGMPAIRLSRSAKQLSEQTIRGFYSTQTIIALLNVGLLDEMAVQGSVDLAVFAEAKNLDLSVLQTLCDYLYELKFLTCDGHRYGLDSDGELAAGPMRGAYQIITAYKDVLDNVEHLLRQDMSYGRDVHRNPEHMALGSGSVGRLLAFPIVSDEIRRRGYRRILDLGCGDASLLIYLCRANQQLQGIGLDLEPEGLSIGQQSLAAEDLRERVALMAGDIYHLGIFAGTADSFQAVTMVYVLHEFQDQIVTVLKGLKAALPNSRLLICEVIGHSPQELREKPGGLSEIQFFHKLSSQRLFTRQEWRGMFEAAGFTNVEENYYSFARTCLFIVN